MNHFRQYGSTQLGSYPGISLGYSGTLHARQNHSESCLETYCIDSERWLRKALTRYFHSCEGIRQYTLILRVSCVCSDSLM